MTALGLDGGDGPKPALRRGDRMTVMVEKLSFEGPGIGFADNGVEADGSPRRLKILLEGVVPGDEVELEIFSVRHGEARGRVVKFLQYSAARVGPRCPHFGVKSNAAGEPSIFLENGRLDLSANCGGCAWQFLKYENQLQVKENIVKSALTGIGEIPPADLGIIWQPIMAADDPWGYRNKMDFSFVRDREGALHLGLHMKGRFNDVTEIRECHLFRPWVGYFLEVMRPFFSDCQMGPEGVLKSLIVRAGTNTGEVMVNLLVENAQIDWAAQFAEKVRDFFTGLSGQTSDKLVSVFLTRIINRKGQPTKQVEELLWGAPVFREELRLTSLTLNFEVAPQAFLQPNTRQAENFYSLVGKLAGLRGTEKVFDLFCGTGTIGISLADAAGQVTGMELNAPAVDNARRNAELNGVKNISFMVGDVAKLLPELGAAVDLIVVDPPRAGLTAKIIESIAATAARRLIYVSCNPFTLARDLKMLRAQGFRLSFAQAIDQFSQTYHTETVTMLERTESGS